MHADWFEIGTHIKYLESAAITDALTLRIAAGGAQSAEALSGLARAFFYAGARSLLVSHWEVASDATVTLITKAIAELKANPKIGRAEALRRSMLSIIDSGKPYEAHPSFWAPFVLVGEGGEGR
jgi:CHAT domain-containing protein